VYKLTADVDATTPSHNQVKKFKHICGSDQLTHTLTRDQENTGSDWLGKMTSFNPSRKSVNLNYNRHSSKNIDFAIYNHNGTRICPRMNSLIPRSTGLPWGLNFNPHTHPIPTEKPVGIPTESPYPQNPEILHTRTLHPVYFV